jgi:hypothetical protein
MVVVVIYSLLRKVFGEQMLDSEVSTLTEVLLALRSLYSIPPTHTPAEASHICMMLNELCCFIALHLISNVYVRSGYVHKIETFAMIIDFLDNIHRHFFI